MSAAKNIFLMLFLTYWAGHGLAIVNAADDKTVELAKKEGRVNVIFEDVLDMSLLERIDKEGFVRSLYAAK